MLDFAVNDVIAAKQSGDTITPLMELNLQQIPGRWDPHLVHYLLLRVRVGKIDARFVFLLQKSSRIDP